MSLPCTSTCWRERRDHSRGPVPGLGRAHEGGRREIERDEVGRSTTAVPGEQGVPEQSSPTENMAILP